MNKVSLTGMLLVTTFLTLTGIAHADEKEKHLVVTGAWIPEAPPVAKMNAGYLKVKNNTDKSVAIIRVTSEDFESVQIHRTVTENGMSRMLPQRELIIPPHDDAVFERGGLHLMLMHPRHPLKVGDKVEIRFITSEDDDVTFTAAVKPAKLDDDPPHHH